MLAVAAGSADHAGVYLAAVDADAEAGPFRAAARDSVCLGLQLERRRGGTRRVIGLVVVLVEDDHQLVAHDLVDVAAGGFELRHEPLEVRAQHRRALSRRSALGEARVALQVGKEDAHVARARERPLEVERAEALLVPLGARAERDRGEAQQHQQVPLPPGGAPVPRPDDHEHRLREQRECERHAEEHERAATQI